MEDAIAYFEPSTAPASDRAGIRAGIQKKKPAPRARGYQSFVKIALKT